MSGVNKVIVLGYLGRDPEMRYTQDGTAIANFSIATSETYKDREGNKQERTEWHRVLLYRRQAKVAGEYLKKGSMAYVEGRLQTRKWTDKEGQEHYTTEIIGDRLQLMGGRRDDDGGEAHAQPAGQSSDKPAAAAATTGTARRGGGGGSAMPPAPEPDFDDDDIPFAVPFDLPARRLARVRF